MKSLNCKITVCNCLFRRLRMHIPMADQVTSCDELFEYFSKVVYRHTPSTNQTRNEITVSRDFNFVPQTGDLCAAKMLLDNDNSFLAQGLLHLQELLSDTMMAAAISFLLA